MVAYRELSVHSIEEGNKTALVLANGFIENGFWYLNKSGKHASLAKSLSDCGYDIHILSFNPNREAFRKKHIPSDASFREIVENILPEYFEKTLPNYEKVHLVGHSYGAPLLLCYLLGYEQEAINKAYSSNAEKAEQRQKQIASFISLSGMYKIAWPAYTPFKEKALNPFWMKKGLPVLARMLPISKLNKFIPIIPFDTAFSLLKNPFVSKIFHSASHLLYLAGLNPVFFPPNNNADSLIKSLMEGCTFETFEAVGSILSVGDESGFLTLAKHAKSYALRNFSSDLRNFTAPIFFLQGEKDFMTHPEIVKKYGFDLVSSPLKELISIPNTGHQDLFTGKHSQKVANAIQLWVNKVDG